MNELDAAIYSAIKDLSSERGFPPTIREVMARAGSHSHRSTHVALGRLRAAGRVTWEEGVNRTLRVLQAEPGDHGRAAV